MSQETNSKRINVLFVCMGNICRSPMAEAVFRDLIKRAGLTDRFEINSAGTGDWHVGELPHRGTRETLQRHHVDATGLVAKHVSQTMLDRADYVVAMDYENVSDLRAWRVERQKLSRLLDYALDQQYRDVPDPYYDGRFELVYELVHTGSERLLEYLVEQHDLR